MNNCINVQSPSFGMSYRKGNIKEIAAFLNKQEPAALNELTVKMANAVEKLKDTVFTEVTLRADREGNSLSHSVYWKAPKFNEKGEVYFVPGCATIAGIDDAVNFALEKEKAMTAAFEYANKQAEVLKAMK